MIPNLPFGAIINPSATSTHVDDLNISALRELFRREHLLVLRGFHGLTDRDALVKFCQRWGEISMWPFGEVLELVEQPNPEDHIFDSSYVPMHWDGMYRPQVPEIQIFHCVHSPGIGNGGQTTFSNTNLALARATDRERELWARATGIYERKMEFYHSKTVAPVVTKHPTTGAPIIRYCEPPRADDENFVNHPEFAITGLSDDEQEEFATSLHNAIYADANYYAHDWQTGDIVISDNYTLLHGRDAFTSGAPRHLRRVHVLGSPALDNPHLEFHS